MEETATSLLPPPPHSEGPCVSHPEIPARLAFLSLSSLCPLGPWPLPPRPLPARAWHAPCSFLRQESYLTLPCTLWFWRMACHDVDGADRTLSPNRRPAPRSYPRQAQRWWHCRRSAPNSPKKSCP